MKNIRDLINFSINDARVVCTLAELETTSATASHLNITQSLVNATIVRTEEKLGVKLFYRGKKDSKFTPTAAAKQIIPTLKTIAQLADKISFSPSDDDNPLKGKVKITSSHTMLEYYLGPYVKDLLFEYPDIELSLNQQDSLSSPFQEPNEITLTCVLDDVKNYKYYPYHSFRQKFWASDEYVKRFGMPKKLEDLEGHILFLRCHTDDPSVIFGSKILQSETPNLPALRMCEVSGVRIIDYLCSQGCGIAAASEESMTVAGVQLHNVLPNFVGDRIELFVKVYREFVEFPLGKFFINWIFKSRDDLFKKKGIEPSAKFEPLK